MPDILWIPFAAAVGYVSGALPFAYWIARRHGVDILEAGSGNPGATNVRRTVGKRAGNAVFVCDFLKGLAAALWPFLAIADANTAVLAAIAALAAAIAGHSYSVFLRFRGGKGVATTMGGLAAIVPWAVLIGVVAWAATFYLFRYVSLASLLFALSLPVSVGVLAPEPNPLLLYFSMAVALLIFYRHRSNIRNLLKGTEHRFTPGAGEQERKDEGDNGRG